jgi:hypothetical protein
MAATRRGREVESAATAEGASPDADVVVYVVKAGALCLGGVEEPRRGLLRALLRELNLIWGRRHAIVRQGP